MCSQFAEFDGDKLDLFSKETGVVFLLLIYDPHVLRLQPTIQF